MNTPRPEFLRGAWPGELFDDPSIVMLSPLRPYTLHGKTPIYQAVSHGTDAGDERFVILDSVVPLQGRTKFHYFGSVRLYLLWMKWHGKNVRGALVYPTCYNLKGARIPGALLLATYG